MTTVPDRALIYVTDPMCSWCWGFSPVIRKLSEATGLPVEVMAGGLAAGPGARTLDAEMRATLSHHWEEVQARSGQPFDHDALAAYPDDWSYDTLLPCMALIAVRTQDPSLALPALEALQRAFYADGKDITSPRVVVDVLAPIVPDVQQLAADLVQAALVEAAASEFGSARELGVQGFPTLFVRSGEDWALAARGWAPVEALLPGLQGWLDAHPAPEPQGESCGIDGEGC
jgi:putative protein-disulfide isomerase